jgi:polyisoprenoid-binding protein YceI
MMINHSVGRFNEFEGEVNFDAHDLANSSIRLTIQAASIDTHNKDRDEHLKAADFFDTVQYPLITFNSRSITKSMGKYTLTGDLTMKGVTKKISLPVHIEGPVKNQNDHEVVGITGEMAINRKDFGISFNKTIEGGKPMVDDQVKIDINLEAKK